MKLSAVLFAFIGTQTRSDALPLSDELKAVSNFDYWAQSVTQSPVFGKEESLGVSHAELPFVIYRLLKKSNVWASRHLLEGAQARFDHQSKQLETETLMLMSDLIDSERIPEGRVGRILGKSSSLAAKGDELAELVEAWKMAAEAISTQSQTNLDHQRTFDAAGRLRGIRADLFQLLNAMPEESFNQKSEQEEEQEGSGSGDFYNQPDYNNYDEKDDNTIELVFDSQTGTFDDDVALLLRNGAIDESMIKTGGNVNQATLELGDKRGHGLFEKESNDVPTASVNDMPSFEKYMSGRNNREPRLISGQNKSNNSWLGYSLLGSIGAIFITVSATVCVRRVKSKKDETSGTPIQKLKRYQGHMNQATQQNRPGRTLNHVNFGPTGYNPAFRPQYFNPNQSVNGGFSSAMSTLSSGGSGFGMPNQVPQSAPAFANSQPASMNSHVSRAMSLSSGYGSHGENRSQAPLTNPQDRALPPPPYAKVQY